MDFLLHHLLRRSADRDPHAEALVDGPQRLDFETAWRQAGDLAATLRERGVRRGDRVGLFLTPGIELAISIFAVSRAGGVFVPIHHSLRSAQIRHIVHDCRMSVLLTQGDLLAEVQPAVEAASCAALVVDEPPPACSVDWPEVAIGADLGAILYTSGSTGRPKGVMLSHDNLIAGASIVSDYLRITSRDRLLAALPFSFDAGLNQLTTGVQQGATVVMIRFAFARQILDVLEAERITGLAGVPSLWALLVHSYAALERRKLKLRYITNTGGALPLPVLEKLRSALPETEVILMYGLTEAFRSTYLPAAELDRRPGSMGRAIPNTELLVVDQEGRRCGPGETGELVHHGPTVSLGYWGQPELTAERLRPHPFPPPGGAAPARVCYSGDLVRQDEEGFFYFVGRRDNLIKSSGFRISPTEVEEGLMASGPLRAAAVIGVADEVLGQRVKAFVVPQERATLDVPQLLAECATRMPRHMLPKEIAVVDELPKLTNGKIDYTALRTAPAESGSQLTGSRLTGSGVAEGGA